VTAENLEADGPLTQRDLGERLALTSGAITMLVDRLERAGWVHRRPHPGDRRYVLIELSPRSWPQPRTRQPQRSPTFPASRLAPMSSRTARPRCRRRRS